MTYMLHSQEAVCIVASQPVGKPNVTENVLNESLCVCWGAQHVPQLNSHILQIHRPWLQAICRITHVQAVTQLPHKLVLVKIQIAHKLRQVGPLGLSIRLSQPGLHLLDALPAKLAPLQ